MPTPFIPIENMLLLNRWANSISAYYYAPIFLGGSSLIKSDYRDVDVFAVIHDRHFRIRFGDVDEWEKEGISGEYKIRWEWARECCKRWEEGCCETGLNLDFKIQPKSFVVKRYAEINTYRLDTNPHTWLENYKYKNRYSN